MVLTAFTIDKAKPADKPYKLADGKGLALLVETNGSKLWRFRYRFGGKEYMLTLTTIRARTVLKPAHDLLGRETGRFPNRGIELRTFSICSPSSLSAKLGPKPTKLSDEAGCTC